MQSGNIVYDRHTAVFMHRLFVALENMCHVSGDIGIIEYACLINAAERKDGIPIRELNEHLKRFRNPAHYVELLEEKELVERFRSKGDRRAFSFRANDKGHARIGLIDQSIALALIATEPRLTEEAFEELVVRCRRMSDAFDPSRRVTTFFPGRFVTIVGRYHQAAKQEGAYLGLSSLQVALLCEFDGVGDVLSPERLASGLAVPTDLAMVHLDRMAERQLVALGDDGYELLSMGGKRLETFWARFVPRLERNVQAASAECLELLEELGQFCAYTFA